MSTTEEDRALAALEQWFRDAPGGNWLPDDFMSHESCTRVVITGELADERYFCQMFAAAYQPVETDVGDEEGDVYEVPLIVAQALVWYGGNDDWWAEILDDE